MKYFTKQWYQGNQKLFISKKMRNLSHKAFDDYQEHYKQIEPSLPDNMKDFHLHDCIIVDNEFIGKDFHMKIDSSNSACSLEKLIFVNAKILECDINLDKATWLYDEVYLQQNHFEMHILFDSKKCELGEMVIAFDEIIATSVIETLI